MHPLGNPRKVWGSWDVKSTKLFVFGWKNGQSREKKATNKRFLKKKGKAMFGFGKKRFVLKGKWNFLQLFKVEAFGW